MSNMNNRDLIYKIYIGDGGGGIFDRTRFRQNGYEAGHVFIIFDILEMS